MAFRSQVVIYFLLRDSLLLKNPPGNLLNMPIPPHISLPLAVQLIHSLNLENSRDYGDTSWKEEFSIDFLSALSERIRRTMGVAAIGRGGQHNRQTTGLG